MIWAKRPFIFSVIVSPGICATTTSSTLGIAFTSSSPFYLFNSCWRAQTRNIESRGLKFGLCPIRYTIFSHFSCQSMADHHFKWIREFENPLSTIPVSTVVKMVHIPIKPYSAGDKIHASTMPTMKVTPWPRSASAALQPIPLAVFVFKEDCIITKLLSQLSKNLFSGIHH